MQAVVQTLELVHYVRNSLFGVYLGFAINADFYQRAEHKPLLLIQRLFAASAQYKQAA